jgi:septal ring-binding cell division protein DamX
MRRLVSDPQQGAGGATPAAATTPTEHPCPSCGATVAAGQRYCTNCGARATAPRVAYQDYLKGEGNGDQSPGTTTTSAQGGREWSPLLALVALAALGGMLLVGVLIGKSANDSPNTVTLATATGAATPSASATSTGSSKSTGFTSDWPAGKQGFTVEITTLPQSGTSTAQVDSAKSDASDKGAPDVGALASDEYTGLPAGKYIVYSGVYSTNADATKALASLTKDFPDAKVIEVTPGTGQLPPASGATKPGAGALGDLGK